MVQSNNKQEVITLNALDIAVLMQAVQTSSAKAGADDDLYWCHMRCYQETIEQAVQTRTFNPVTYIETAAEFVEEKNLILPRKGLNAALLKVAGAAVVNYNPKASSFLDNQGVLEPLLGNKKPAQMVKGFEQKMQHMGQEIYQKIEKQEAVRKQQEIQALTQYWQEYHYAA